MIDRAERHPPAETFVAESGVKSVEEVCHLRDNGEDTALIEEVGSDANREAPRAA